MNEQAVRGFMKVYGMSVQALAEWLKLPTALLNNKLNPAYRNKLSEHEKAEIKAYFLALHKHSREFLATDLNELPEALRRADKPE
jgi:hypothetical protein